MTGPSDDGGVWGSAIITTRAAATAGRREEVTGPRAERSKAGDVATNAMMVVGSGGGWMGDAQDERDGQRWVRMGGWLAEVMRASEVDAGLYDGEGKRRAVGSAQRGRRLLFATAAVAQGGVQKPQTACMQRRQ